MLKRVLVALAGLLAMLALAVAPASGAAELDGVVELYEDAHGLTTPVVVPEVEVPDSCESIPVGLSAVRFVDNATDNPGTSVTVYSDSNCELDPVTIGPGDSVGNINDPDGAEFWQITPE